MDLMTIVYIGMGAFLAILLIGMFIMFLRKKKKKPDSWTSSKLLTIQEFNKKHKNILDTKKIRKNNTDEFPTFQSETKSGFLLASSKSRKIPKFPLVPDNHFKKTKYGYECDIKTYLIPKSHVMVFGSTGSGKTDTVLIPNIIFNAVCKDRPSGLVFDPKGEIYEKTAPFLMTQGYKVININLSSSANSDRWSPFQFAIDSAAEHIKWAFIKSLLIDGASLSDEVDAMMKTRISNARTSIEETAKILISLSDKENSIWTNSAKEILALSGTSLLGFLINKANDEILKLSKYKDVEIDLSNYEDLKTSIFQDPELNNIILNHLKFLSIKNVSNIAITTPADQWVRFILSQGWHDKIGTFKSTKEQFQSFGMNIAGALSFLTKPDFEEFISSSDFSYQDLIDKHTMIFINIPSSAEDRKAIATLMVQQIWAFLELKSKSYKGGSLPKPFDFYFEELANIPKIPCFMNILTLGRGMNIFAFVVVQSLQQFEKIYDRGATDIVWTNTMAHIYLLAQDIETRNFISRQCGEVELTKSDGSKIIKPLVGIEQLGEVKHGECLILENREKPIWLNTISYENIGFFHEWERETLLDSHYEHSSFLDHGNKRLKTKTKESLEQKKQAMNIKYTKSSNIPVLPNVIESFNEQQEKDYLSFLIINLISRMLVNEEDQMLAIIKNEILKDCQEQYEILCKNDGLLEVAEVDVNYDTGEVEPISTENQIYTIFINKLITIFSSAQIDSHKNKYHDEMTKYSPKMRNDWAGQDNNQINTLEKRNEEKSNYLKMQLINICEGLKQSNPNFPFKSDNQDLEGLLSFSDLVKSAISKLIKNQEFIIIDIKTYLIKIKFLNNWVLNNINQKKEEKKLAIEILNNDNLQNNQKIDTKSINKRIINKNSLSIEERILKQEAIIETHTTDAEWTEFDVFLKNNIQIFQRAILNYLEKCRNGENIGLNEFLMSAKVNGFPEDLDENFNLSETYIKSFDFPPKLLNILKRVNRAFENQLNKYKEMNNIKFNDLKTKFKDSKIEETKVSHYDSEQKFGGDQKHYYIDQIIKWLESI